MSGRRWPVLKQNRGFPRGRRRPYWQARLHPGRRLRLLQGLRHLRGRMPLRSHRDAARADLTLDRLDVTAGDAVRDDPQEQLPVPGGPGLDARLLGPRARLLGFDVVRGPLEQHAPALTPGYVDVVDLERHQVIAAGDPGLQVLVQRAVPGGPEHDRPVVPLVVHRPHSRAEPAHVGDAADSARRYQPQALGLGQLFDGAVSHGSTIASCTGGMTFNPARTDLRPCLGAPLATRLVMELHEPAEAVMR